MFKNKRWWFTLGLALAFFGLSGFTVYGHRGEPSGDTYPDNTYASWDRAIHDGADYIEMDVHRTVDGQLMICHNATTTYVTGVDDRIVNTPWSDLSQLHYKNGESLHLLSDVLARYRDQPQVHFLIETKIVKDTPDFEVDMADLIKQYGLTSRVEIESFNGDSLSRMRPLLPGVKLMRLSDVPLSADTWAQTHLDDWDIYSPRWQAYSAADVAKAHELGKTYVPWVTDGETQQLAKTVVNTDVDGVITNYTKAYKEAYPHREVVDKTHGVLKLAQKQTLTAGYGAQAETVRTLAAGSSWKYYKTVTVDKQTWYDLGGNQWTHVQPVKVVAVKSKAALAKTPGAKATGKTLRKNSQWRVTKTETVAGQNWYCLGGKQWLSQSQVQIVA